MYFLTLPEKFVKAIKEQKKESMIIGENHISYTMQPNMVYAEADLEHRYDLMSIVEVRIETNYHLETKELEGEMRQLK